jgi:methionyl-tRNA formyltransferase
MNILVIGDNKKMLDEFRSVAETLSLSQHEFTYCTTVQDLVDSKTRLIDVPREYKDRIVDKYELVFSVHCRQLFPAELVKAVRCINLHPGYTPSNRGWYPQVFSIINKQPTGATLHEMDERPDHGPVIAQREVAVEAWDTSLDVYNKIILAEVDLLKENLTQVIDGNYEKKNLTGDSKPNTIKDFQSLCQLDMDAKSSLGNTIDVLRALTHPPYDNAYFIDRKTNKKVFVEIRLKPASDE